MAGYYGRDGSPLSTVEWAKSLETDRRVAEDNLPNGRWVSTVWLGLDHRFGDDGPPLIFETMVFPSRGDFGELDADRYATEAEARDGHARLVEKWSAEVIETTEPEKETNE